MSVRGGSYEAGPLFPKGFTPPKTVQPSGNKVWKRRSLWQVFHIRAIEAIVLP